MLLSLAPRSFSSSQGPACPIWGATRLLTGIPARPRQNRICRWYHLILLTSSMRQSLTASSSLVS